MKTLMILGALVAMLSTAESADKESWTGAVKALGLRKDSQEFQSLTANYGQSSAITDASSEYLIYKKAFLMFRFDHGRCVEVEIQIGPGKKIEDTGYRGELPEGIIESRGSPEIALQILGKPLSDLKEHGYRRITYPVNGMLMTLYFGPGLDYLTFTIKATEQSAP